MKRLETDELVGLAKELREMSEDNAKHVIRTRIVENIKKTVSELNEAEKEEEKEEKKEKVEEAKEKKDDLLLDKSDVQKIVKEADEKADAEEKMDEAKDGGWKEGEYHDTSMDDLEEGKNDIEVLDEEDDEKEEKTDEEEPMKEAKKKEDTEEDKISDEEIMEVLSEVEGDSEEEEPMKEAEEEEIVLEFEDEDEEEEPMKEAEDEEIEISLDEDEEEMTEAKKDDEDEELTESEKEDDERVMKESIREKRLERKIRYLESLNSRLTESLNEAKSDIKESMHTQLKAKYLESLCDENQITLNDKVKIMEAFDKVDTKADIKMLYESLTKKLRAKARVKNSLGEHRKTVKALDDNKETKEPLTESVLFSTFKRLSGSNYTVHVTKK